MDPLIVFIKYLHGHNLHNLHVLINLSKEFCAERGQKKSPLFYLAPNEIFILFNELFILILNIKIPKFFTYFNETAFPPGDVSGRHCFSSSSSPPPNRCFSICSSCAEKTQRLLGDGYSPITTMLRSFLFFFYTSQTERQALPPDSQSGVGAGSNN